MLRSSAALERWDIEMANELEFAVFRQEKFQGWSRSATAIDALNFWIETPRSDGTDLRKLKGPWSAVERQEAINRRMI